MSTCPSHEGATHYACACTLERLHLLEAALRNIVQDAKYGGPDARRNIAARAKEALGSERNGTK